MRRLPWVDTVGSEPWRGSLSDRVLIAETGALRFLFHPCDRHAASAPDVDRPPYMAKAPPLACRMVQLHHARTGVRAVKPSADVFVAGTALRSTLAKPARATRFRARADHVHGPPKPAPPGRATPPRVHGQGPRLARRMVQLHHAVGILDFGNCGALQGAILPVAIGARNAIMKFETGHRGRSSPFSILFRLPLHCRRPRVLELQPVGGNSLT